MLLKLLNHADFLIIKQKILLQQAKHLLKNSMGKFQKNFSALLSLPGVGQKTANVLTSVGFGGDAFAVDTHVFRVSKRLGLANEKTPEKVEEQLKKVFCKNMWSETHHLMVLFGRYYCKAKNPQCNDCKLKEICLYYNNLKK
jgi:endonuclease-3